ncbi:uncharacterized protein LOC133731940 isoform X2 [Rosa rugosa]|uniref:uncharacterized protein LOC133731940 isoform X2 n=1 Tax=Rosa rugosa TaxID=74645 RepID=UPI002B409E00|nr:uncharacterized protein LOC133731940 isoform X2 [Rosa rugosa]
MSLSWRELRDLEYAGRRPDPFESLGFRLPPAAVLRRLARDYPDTVKIPDPLADTTTSTSASPYPEAPLAAPLTPHPLSFFDNAYTIQKLQTEKCMYCTKVGVHGTASCSYTRRVPKNAPVGPGCELVCRICESPFSGTCCGLDEGRAILKECIICGVYGDHWPRWCPRNNRVDKKLLDLPPGVFHVDFSRGTSAPGKVEQKEPAKPASVKSNAVKDDDPEDDHDSDDEDDETPTPKKPGSKRRARASASAKTPVSAKEAKIDTDGEKGPHSDTPHPADKGKTPPTDKQLQSLSFGSDGGLQSHNEDNDSAKM